MKKGFTLIELLVIIIILGIITLITTPIIRDILDASEQRAYLNSSYGVVKAADLYYSSSFNNEEKKDKISNFVNLLSELELKGKKPELGMVHVNNKGKVGLALKYEDRCYKKEFDEDVITTLDYNPVTCKVDNEAEEPEIVTEPNVPNLHDNMIAIKYDGSKWVKADKLNTAKEWFDYENLKWANAVTVTSTSREAYKTAAVGTEVLEEDILTYMVWIPRYEYKIDGTYGKNGTSLTSPGEIEVNFTASTSPSSGYIMHPGFTFGSEELTGFWIGKFKSSTTDAVCNTTANATNCNKYTHEIRIKPNVASLRNITLGNMFNVSLLLSNNSNYGYGNVESHMIKNSEWGAVAYLSQSKYGKYGTGTGEVWINNSSTYITGCAGNNVSASSYAGCQNTYNTSNGQNASTTGTIYGVYDMSGEGFEYVMGNYKNTIGLSGLGSVPGAKYCDLYTTDMASTACLGDICYGHALSETAGWYGGTPLFVFSTHPWFLRAGGGVFNRYISNGRSDASYTFRLAHK